MLGPSKLEEPVISDRQQLKTGFRLIHVLRASELKPSNQPVSKDSLPKVFQKTLALQLETVMKL